MKKKFIVSVTALLDTIQIRQELEADLGQTVQYTLTEN